jgi:glyoxylase-like metal-dependent hydrolase (beta-lactamase superfamily II)
MHSYYRIYKIEIPTPFIVGTINVYFIDCAEPTLIDTGPLTPDAYRTLTTGIKNLGYELTCIRRIFLTHWHPDHIGLAGKLRTVCNAEICAHERDLPIIEDYITKYEKLVTIHRAYMAKAGMPDTLIEQILQYSNVIARTAEPVAVDRVLNDNDRFRYNDELELRIIHSPGHTSGSISLYEPKNKVLFTGDTLLKEITTNAFFKGPQKDELVGVAYYQQTLQRLQQLDVYEIYPGHGENITEHRVIIGDILHELSARREKILDIIGKKERHRPYEVATKLFPNLPVAEVWLALAETLGHLEYLEHENRVRAAEHETCIYYYGTCN